MTIKELREFLKQQYYAAYYVGGYGVALMSALDIDRADLNELKRLAESLGYTLTMTEIGE